MASRLRVPDRDVEFVDRVQSRQVVNVSRTVGDFVLRRRDGLFAYQLAVVVDDAAQGVTDVVRGADLLASTPRQMLVQEALGLPTPTYMHVPLAVDARGLKLSKSEDAPGVALAEPAAQLAAALGFLAQEPPDELARGTVDDVWGWAVSHWRAERFAGVMSRVVPAQVLRPEGQEDIR
jgi:glutamyl-Q tRNA(Asp) synthetase